MKRKFSLIRVRLNSQGYTSQGDYYGVGLPLYWTCDVESGLMLRALNRADAKAKVRTQFRHDEISFYN